MPLVAISSEPFKSRFKQSRWKDPRTLRSGGLVGHQGPHVTYEKILAFNGFNRPHKTKSWLRHWILFINTHSAVSQIQSIRQILPLSLDIPMLKSSQLQGGFAPVAPWPGLYPWIPLGAPPPDPRLNMGHRITVVFGGGGLQLSGAGTGFKLS